MSRGATELDARRSVRGGFVQLQMQEGGKVRPRGFREMFLICAGISTGAMLAYFLLAVPFCGRSASPAGDWVEYLLSFGGLLALVAVGVGAMIGLASAYVLKAGEIRLAVEDEEEFRQGMKEALGLIGYRLVEDSGGGMRFRRHRLQPDVIVELREETARVIGPHLVVDRIERLMTGRGGLWS